MKIYENFSLKNYNTFGIDAKTQFFTEITAIEHLQEVLSHPRWNAMPKMILGEGSNVLFSRDFPGLVIKISLKGIQKTAENEQYVWITAGAGENWHQLVLYCLDHQLAGVENLSLIPGTVGAAPMQNIGAYGVEIKQVFDHLRAVQLSDGEQFVFDNPSCQFDYRDSVFKKHLKNQFVISSVTLRLHKNPTFHLDYGAIKKTLELMQAPQVNIRTISDAVIKIRQEKLPDPKKIGNAGSFFKNPILNQDQFNLIHQKHPEIPYYAEPNQHFKIPAAWLIEQCGWKGHRKGDTGIHEHHALVLVNYGQGSGQQIKQLAEEIQQSVNEKFSILLTPEVNII